MSSEGVPSLNEEEEVDLKSESFCRAYQEYLRAFVYDDTLLIEDSSPKRPFFSGIENANAFVDSAPRGVDLVWNSRAKSWDALVRKVPTVGQRAATSEFAKQLGIYADA